MEEQIEEKEQITATSLIDKANTVAKRIEEGNKETERLQAVQIELNVKKQLGGSTEAGESIPEETNAEKTIKGAQDFFKDTALGETIRKADELNKDRKT